MARPAVRARHAIEAFDEKQFYLDEFRGRTLLLTVPAAALADDDALADLLFLLSDVYNLELCQVGACARCGISA